MEDEANRGTYTRYGGVVRFPQRTCGGQVIWGLTYRVLMRFLRVIRQPTD